MRKVEFEFPDEKEERTEIEVEPARNRAENVLGPMEPLDLPSKEKDEDEVEGKGEGIKTGDVEIEVEDDTPLRDRGKKPSDPAPEPTEEELEGQSNKVKKRLRHMTKTIHDERRRAEAAERERQAALDYARQLMQENDTLKQSSTRSRNGFIASAKKTAEAEVLSAKQEYRQAYESGDADKVTDALAKLSEAVARKSRLEGVKAEPLQRPDNTVQRDGQRVAPTQIPERQAPPAPDPELQEWMEENSWFGVDEAMTGFAYGLHNRFKKENKPLKGKEYYDALNREIRKRFPEEFEDDDAPVAGTRQEGVKKVESDSVVAPVSRSSAPKRFKLKASEVAIAKELGVPLERYARQVARLALKETE